MLFVYVLDLRRVGRVVVAQQVEQVLGRLHWNRLTLQAQRAVSIVTRYMQYIRQKSDYTLICPVAMFGWLGRDGLTKLESYGIFWHY